MRRCKAMLPTAVGSDGMQAVLLSSHCGFIASKYLQGVREKRNPSDDDAIVIVRWTLL